MGINILPLVSFLVALCGALPSLRQRDLERHDTFNLRALLDTMETYDSNGDSMLENGRGAVRRRGKIPYGKKNGESTMTDSSSSPPQMQKENLDRRSLLDLSQMIRKATGRNALEYNGYGCYCGLGGRGSPVDSIDRCCKIHDECYRSLEGRYNCKMLKFTSYNWWTSQNKVVCSLNQSWCKFRLCNCDVSFVECIKRHQYNDRYHGWKWLLFKNC